PMGTQRVVIRTSGFGFSSSLVGNRWVIGGSPEGPMTRDLERQALWAAVRAQPDDDAPRLVFANWLEEHGPPSDAARAGFIRAQCELARVGASKLVLASEARRIAPGELAAFDPGREPPPAGSRVTVACNNGDRLEGLLVLGSEPGSEAGLLGHHLHLRRDEESRRRSALRDPESELLAAHAAHLAQ